MTAVAKLDDASANDLPPGWALCQICHAPFDSHHGTGRNCELHRGLRSTGTGQVDHVTTYEDDVAAQLFTSLGGMTLGQVALVVDSSRQRVEQIEKRALRILRSRLQLAGVSEQDVRDFFASLVEERRARARGPYRQRSPQPARDEQALAAWGEDLRAFDPHARSPEVRAWLGELDEIADRAEERLAIIARADVVDRDVKPGNVREGDDE